jgi:hypothetical protein
VSDTYKDKRKYQEETRRISKKTKKKRKTKAEIRELKRWQDV